MDPIIYYHLILSKYKKNYRILVKMFNVNKIPDWLEWENLIYLTMDGFFHSVIYFNIAFVRIFIF